ncbi:MAG: hypothetical protein ABWJ97_06130 [Thermoproteus sp.]
MKDFLSEAQSFIFSIVREKWSPASPLSLSLAATAATLYAFRADLYSLAAAAALSLIVARSKARVVANAVAAAGLFTLVIYALGFVIARGVPEEALPTLYRALSSAALMSAFVADRGFTPSLLSLTCLGVDGTPLAAMLKSVLLSPSALRDAVAAYKALRGRLDLEGAAFAVAYMLRRIEVRYREVYVAAKMTAPACRVEFSPTDLAFAAAIVIWPFV